MRVIIKEKLVRDRIPEIIEKSGGSAIVRIATGEELDMFLRKKIVEEAQELLESGDIDEIVDIYEALEAFAKHRKVDSGLLETQKLAKNLARGGFTEGFILEME